MVETNKLGIMETNCYIVSRENIKKAIIIDPASDAEYIMKKCEEQDLEVIAILLTHGHFDHIGAVNQIREKYQNATVYAGYYEQDVLGKPSLNLSDEYLPILSTKADVYLHDNEVMHLLDSDIICFHVPGHTKGGMSYYFKDEKMIFTGDTLFHARIGRSDYPTGNRKDLEESIRSKILVLPEDIKVYPGHGDDTNIGWEKENNPFMDELQLAQCKESK